MFSYNIVLVKTDRLLVLLLSNKRNMHLLKENLRNIVTKLLITVTFPFYFFAKTHVLNRLSVLSVHYTDS